MSKQDTGGQAFPIIGTHEQVLEVGMTLRDYFAAKAMQGIIAQGPSNFSTNDQSLGSNFALIADAAYGIADDMLRARESVGDSGEG
jgi:hypothetical protein